MRRRKARAADTAAAPNWSGIAKAGNAAFFLAEDHTQFCAELFERFEQGMGPRSHSLPFARRFVELALASESTPADFDLDPLARMAPPVLRMLWICLTRLEGLAREVGFVGYANAIRDWQCSAGETAKAEQARERLFRFLRQADDPSEGWDEGSTASTLIGLKLMKNLQDDLLKLLPLTA